TGSKATFASTVSFINSGSSSGSSQYQVASGTSDTAIFNGAVTTTNTGSSPNTIYYFGNGNSSYVSISSLALSNTGSGTNTNYNFAAGGASNVAILAGSTITNAGTGTNDILNFANGVGSTVSFPTGMTFFNSSPGGNSAINVSSGNGSFVTFNGTSTFNNKSTGTNGTISIASGTSSNVTMSGPAIFNNTETGTNGNTYISNGNSSLTTFSSTLAVNNNGTATNNNIVDIANATSSGVLFNGNVTFNNSATGSTAYIRVDEGATSTATFNGAYNINNTGIAANCYVRTALQGTVICNGNIIVSNTSTAAGTNGIYFAWPGWTGTTTLSNGNTITNGSFPIGVLQMINFTQVGGTSQAMTLTGTANMTIGPNSAFNGSVNFISPQMYLNGCVYSGATSFLEKDGATNNTSTGGNIFNSNTTIEDISTGKFTLANTTGDDFQKSATFIQTGTGALQPTYLTTSTFEGNISTLGTATAITFGAGGAAGISKIDGTTTQNIFGAAAQTPTFTTLNMNQSVGDSEVLNVPINISTALNLTTGTIKSTTTYLPTMLNASITTVGNTLSYVN
ncbi:MAG TPA: hypothetical protein VNZ45_09280, partial [Bacteroidia bacterium]|nr:hypothetical protein [Bacteroidia bacterium]